MESNKVFHCTRSERNIPYSYYAARKHSYLSIPGPLINILTNLQSKIDRLATDSSSIIEGVIIQLARDLDFRIRRAEKKARGALLNEIKNSSSLKNILHLLLHTIKRDVKLFAEAINLLFQYLLIIASSDNRIRRII
jgi:hypothetical protein